jgi:hypothetical protein
MTPTDQPDSMTKDEGSKPDMSGIDLENAAWDWLDRKFANVERGDDPVDRAYDASEMVDAFHAGHSYRHPTRSSADNALRQAEAVAELLAKAIYGEWERESGFVPWVERGNSMMQEEARRKAWKFLEANPPYAALVSSPTTQQATDECERCHDSGFVEMSSGGHWTGENIATSHNYCDCDCGQDARDQDNGTGLHTLSAQQAAGEITNGAYEADDFCPIGDAARQIASYCEGEARENVYRAAKIALATPQPTETQRIVAWQPIESAPKDGTWFLGYWPVHTREERVCATSWSDDAIDGYMGRFVDIADHIDWTQPTHWMHLPSTPSSKER